MFKARKVQKSILSNSDGSFAFSLSCGYAALFRAKLCFSDQSTILIAAMPPLSFVKEDGGIAAHTTCFMQLKSITFPQIGRHSRKTVLVHHLFKQHV